MSKYDEYKNTDLWKLIDSLFSDLEQNSDVQITTAREYAIGYFCENLQNRYQLIKNPEDNISE